MGFWRDERVEDDLLKPVDDLLKFIDFLLKLTDDLAQLQNPYLELQQSDFQVSAGRALEFPKNQKIFMNIDFPMIFAIFPMFFANFSVSILFSSPSSAPFQ